MSMYSRCGIPAPPSELEQCKMVYRRAGYTNEKDFPKEYYFMHNPDTGECVRLYYSGRVHEYRK